MCFRWRRPGNMGQVATAPREENEIEISSPLLLSLRTRICCLISAVWFWNWDVGSDEWNAIRVRSLFGERKARNKTWSTCCEMENNNINFALSILRKRKMLIGMSLKCDFDSSKNSLPNQIGLKKEMKFHRVDSESYQKSGGKKRFAAVLWSSFLAL